MFYRPNDYFIDQNLVSFTNIIGSIYYYASQVIDENSIREDGSSDNFISTLIPSFEISLLFILSVLFYYLILLILKANNLKKIMSMTFTIFLFFSAFFFGSNLNTSYVVVDSSGLINSKSSLLNTKKELCFIGMTRLIIF